MDDDRRAAITLELQQGDTALRAARALRDLAMPNDALSRLYYAMFHYVTALLQTQGLEPRRHRALPALLTTHFVAKGIVDAADVALVGRVSGYRDLADYQRGWIAPRDIVDDAFRDVEMLIAKVMSLLGRDGWLEPST
jgi:uncharacterized protein (UPF0332 family)